MGRSDYQKEYYQKNKKKLDAYRKKRYREKEGKGKWSWRTIRNRELRGLIIEKYGGKCVKCEFSDVRALQIDHVNGGGNREKSSMSHSTYLRKVLKDSSGTYQLLCANCNWIKRCEQKEINFSGR